MWGPIKSWFGLASDSSNEESPSPSSPPSPPPVPAQTPMLPKDLGMCDAFSSPTTMTTTTTTTTPTSCLLWADELLLQDKLRVLAARKQDIDKKLSELQSRRECMIQKREDEKAPLMAHFLEIQRQYSAELAKIDARHSSQLQPIDNEIMMLKTYEMATAEREQAALEQQLKDIQKKCQKNNNDKEITPSTDSSRKESNENSVQTSKTQITDRDSPQSEEVIAVTDTAYSQRRTRSWSAPNNGTGSVSEHSTEILDESSGDDGVLLALSHAVEEVEPGKCDSGSSVKEDESGTTGTSTTTASEETNPEPELDDNQEDDTDVNYKKRKLDMIIRDLNDDDEYFHCSNLKCPKVKVLPPRWKGELELVAGTNRVNQQLEAPVGLRSDDAWKKWRIHNRECCGHNEDAIDPMFRRKRPYKRARKNW